MGSDEEDEEDGTEGFGADQAVDDGEQEEQEEQEEEEEEEEGEEEEDDDNESDVGYPPPPPPRRCFAVQTNAILVGCCLTRVLMALWCTLQDQLTVPPNMDS